MRLLRRMTDGGLLAEPKTPPVTPGRHPPRAFGAKRDDRGAAMTTVALIAHDRMKPEMVSWAKRHEAILARCAIVATGTIGGLIKENCPSFSVTLLKSGPMGGDQQAGAMIAEQKIDALFFFTDPLSAMSHDVDVKALTRLSTLYNIPMACNPATADYIITKRQLTS